MVLVLNALLLISSNSYAIDGGLPTELEQTPWAIKIFGCGASFISETYIITAAHCVINLKPHEIKPRGGGSSVKTELNTLPSVKKIIIHPEYTNWNKDHIEVKYADLAILELESKVTFSETLQPVNLPFTNILNSRLISNQQSNVAIMGWGNTGEMIPSTSKLKVINNIFLLPGPKDEYWANGKAEEELFTKTISKTNVIATFMTGDYLIVKNKFGQSCKGDSGGPMIDLSTNTIIGVSAHNMGTGCGHDKYFFYTDVSKSIDWINSIIK